MGKTTNKNFIPPFLMIPTRAILDSRMKPADKIVLGVILYFERLKNGFCTASNKTIGAIAGCSTATARDSISRLQKVGYIKCFYKDENRRIRERIVTTISLTTDTRVSSDNDRGVVNQRHRVSSGDEQNENNKREYNNVTDKPSRPFNFSEWLEEIENSGKRHLEVIGFFFKEKGIKFKTRDQANTALKRHLKAAKEVALFTDEDIVKVTEKLKREFPDFTVETIYKQLTK